MSCASADEIGVCAWWESAVGDAAMKAFDRDCESGDRVACLEEGLGYVARQKYELAATHIASSCTKGEELACIYLAHTHTACAHPAEERDAGARAACVPGLVSYFDDHRAESELIDDCEKGYGVGCYFLGIGPWRRKDNKVPVLERGCRYGVMASCRALYDELSGLVPPPSASPTRLLVTQLQMVDICTAQPVDCYDVAAELASVTHLSKKSYSARACNPRNELHLPAKMCVEAPATVRSHP